MSRIVYVNGSFVPEADAKVSVSDRAFLFADGVYEVTAVLGGSPIDLDAHLSRLDRSLAEMQIAPPLRPCGKPRLASGADRRMGSRKASSIWKLRGVATAIFFIQRMRLRPSSPSPRAGRCSTMPMPSRGSRSSPSPICAGSGATSNPRPCSLKPWASRRRSFAAPMSLDGRGQHDHRGHLVDRLHPRRKRARSHPAT